MAELKVFAGQCPLGGGILHLGATSMDIKDNAEVLQIAQSLDILLPKAGTAADSCWPGRSRSTPLCR